VGIGLRAPKEISTDLPARRKRKNDTSSDSSLLEVPLIPRQRPHREADLKIGPPAGEQEFNPPRKSRKTVATISRTSTPSSCASSAQKQNIFEKRPRHKPREDRYEPKKKVEKRSKDGEEKGPRKKKEQKGNRKRAAKKSGEDLVRNFSSRSIGQERITASVNRIIEL
jgi:hypothetical protein